MDIASSINGVNTIRNLSLIKRSLDRTMQRFSSDSETPEMSENRPELMISERMRAQIGSLTQAIKNLETNSDKYRAAEGALGQLREQVKAMREVATAGLELNAPSEEEAAAVQEQMNILIEDYNEMRSNAVWGDQKLLDGSPESVIHVPSMNALDVSDSSASRETLSKINDSLRGMERAQVRIEAKADSEYESTIKSLEVSSQNLVAAESIIRDSENAAEQAQYVRQIIQLDAGAATVAQGNLESEAVYKLLHT